MKIQTLLTPTTLPVVVVVGVGVVVVVVDVVVLVVVVPGLVVVAQRSSNW